MNANGVLHGWARRAEATFSLRKSKIRTRKIDFMKQRFIAVA